MTEIYLVLVLLQETSVGSKSIIPLRYFNIADIFSNHRKYFKMSNLSGPIEHVLGNILQADTITGMP